MSQPSSALISELEELVIRNIFFYLELWFDNFCDDELEVNPSIDLITGLLRDDHLKDPTDGRQYPDRVQVRLRFLIKELLPEAKARLRERADDAKKVNQFFLKTDLYA